MTMENVLATPAGRTRDLGSTAMCDEVGRLVALAITE